MPTDLLSSLLLLFDSNELSPLLLLFDSTKLLIMLQQLEKISDFARLLNSNVFWRKIWRRDISSFLKVPDNPYEKYKQIFHDLSKLNLHSMKIEYLAENGYDILLYLITNSTDYTKAIQYAAYGGHIEIVEKLLGKIQNVNYNAILLYAADGGHIKIVDLMLEKGANDLNGAMSIAAHNGHIDIVNLMLSKGATDYNCAMAAAASGGKINILKLMMAKGANVYM